MRFKYHPVVVDLWWMVTVGLCAMMSLLSRNEQGDAHMYTIAVLLVIGWLVGLIGGYTLNGLIHILLALAIVVVLLRVIQGRAV